VVHPRVSQPGASVVIQDQKTGQTRFPPDRGQRAHRAGTALPQSRHLCPALPRCRRAEGEEEPGMARGVLGLPPFADCHAGYGVGGQEMDD